ncbi:sulfate ABC transporter permease subunit CysT [Actinoallomurus bryophytorum]|uniref:Sulfate transport system permease protein CysT n=1 Tax=Actinoallomurus bryophytorum TaxID=1490222 RepID=A0A543CFH5_9ACTN|nr:sulfate ABC transporter permease subunit CysT [Actinoallomurus bryophytorum]TQL95849.1 sulfate transport system permease protein [Actinoallomurus bryophytorum]
MTSETLETDSAGSGTPPDPVRPVARRRPPSAPTALGLGSAMIFLSLIVLIPLAAVLWKSAGEGPGFFWKSVTTPDAWAALKLTIVASVIVALINLVMGTLIAWVLVRDSFPGKAVLDTLIDLPFALPTIVAGLVLLELYGADSPLGINLAYTRVGVAVALLFVTLPFVVRTVQPVLLELDRDMEQAAASLGAGNWTIFRRIILPNLLPAMISGTALAFTRSIAEFGSTVLISGNLPFKTQVAAVQIFGQIENDNTASAAAVSTALLVVAFVLLVALDLVQRWGSRRG